MVNQPQIFIKSLLQKITYFLPWRIQSLIGFRPYRSISVFNKLSCYKIKRTINEPELENILPVYSNRKSYASFFQGFDREHYKKHCSEFSLLEIKEIRLYNLDHQVAIIHRNSVIKEFSTYMNRNFLTGEITRNEHPIRSVDKLDPVSKYISNKTLVINTIGSHNNYFHFTLDTLSKIGNFLSFGNHIETVDQILINHNSAPYVSQWFEILGIPFEKVYQIQLNEHLRVQHAFVPFNDKHGYNGFQFVKNKGLEYIRKVRGGIPFATKKILVSRKPNEGRCFINEDKLLSEFLIPKGYIQVYLQDLSVLEQIYLFLEAKEIILAHGAGMTNIVFCQPETKVIEVHDETVPFNTDYYPYVVFNHLKYACYLAQSQTNSFKQGALYNDLILDRTDLTELMNKMQMLEEASL